LVRVAIGLSTASGAASTAVPPTALYHMPAHTVAFQQPIVENPPAGKANAPIANTTAPNMATAQVEGLAPVRNFIVVLLAVLAAITCTFGNLVAYGQTNIKRLLAYSTIAHAGYMIMAVAAAVHLAGKDADAARNAVGALVFYLVVYVFMNLGAFAIVAFLRNAMGTEEIADYAGLIRSAPITSVALVTIMISLIGIPPLVGFMGKFVVFSALVAARDNWMMIALLVIAGINTAISLIYYLRVAKVMCIDPEPVDRGPVSIGLVPATYMLVVAIPVLLYGILPARILDVARVATEQLFK
jgi:NADH-quinone oxidoreductase subunit N